LLIRKLNQPHDTHWNRSIVTNEVFFLGNVRRIFSTNMQLTREKVKQKTYRCVANQTARTSIL
jgi:hypothetical protein